MVEGEKHLLQAVFVLFCFKDRVSLCSPVDQTDLQVLRLKERTTMFG